MKSDRVDEAGMRRLRAALVRRGPGYGWGYRGMGGSSRPRLTSSAWDRALRGTKVLGRPRRRALHADALERRVRLDRRARGARRHEVQHSGGVAATESQAVASARGRRRGGRAVERRRRNLTRSKPPSRGRSSETVAAVGRRRGRRPRGRPPLTVVRSRQPGFAQQSPRASCRFRTGTGLVRLPRRHDGFGRVGAGRRWCRFDLRGRLPAVLAGSVETSPCRALRRKAIGDRTPRRGVGAPSLLRRRRDDARSGLARAARLTSAARRRS